MTEPPQLLCGFSRQRSADRGNAPTDGRMALSMSSSGRHAIAVRDGAAVEPAEYGERAHLVLIDVGEIAEDHLVATAGLRQHAAEVPEHAAAHVDAGFLPDDLGCALFEAVHGRVLAVLVVTDLGIGHRLAHRRASAG